MTDFLKIIEKHLPKGIDICSDDILRIISGLRYLSEEFLYYPDNTLEKLFSETSPANLVYYPVDVLQLRAILKDTCNKPEVYFSFIFAKQHFLDNPVIAGFDVKNKQYGSLFLPEKNENAEVKRIYIRDDALHSNIYNAILKIIEEEKANVEVFDIFDVNILKPVKQFSQAFNLMKMAEAELSITEHEKKIFDFILAAINKNPKLKNTQPRVCGGWVRDRLLGIPSDDIDISVAGMTGAQFLEELGLTGHVIAKNPEKSKQLETVKAKIFGQEVDFVNLRTEVYQPGSRIPEMAITNDPAQDAQRRDLSINALFYNLQTGKVEDYVGGLQDLKTMTLKTPMDPIKTFTYDPLRTLRVLRFFSRYSNSKLDPAIIEAFKDPRVQKAYGSLAPSRASKELKKMLEGAKPVEATRILLETGLYKKVFKLPENWHDITIDQQSPYHDLPLIEHILAVMKEYKNIADSSKLPKSEQSLMLLSALLHDFAKMDPDIRKQKSNEGGKPATFDREGKPIEHMRYVGHDKASADFAEKIMTEMAFEPNEKRFVKTITQNHMTPSALLENKNPKSMGRFLNTTGDLYRRVIEHAQSDALGKGKLTDENRKKITETYQNQLKEMEAYKQERGQRISTPLVDGNRLKQLVQEIDPEMVSQNASVVIKSYGTKPVHFMTYLLDALREQQWEKRVNIPDEAEKWLQKAIRSFAALWRQRGQGQNVKKKADASSGTANDEYDTIEGQRPEERVKGIAYMKRTIPTQYSVGNLVRLDVSGSTAKQIIGRIISKKGNIIIVEWIKGKYAGKKKAYDLTDMAGLAGLNVI